jgi:hypothetical protein
MFLVSICVCMSLLRLVRRWWPATIASRHD